MIRAHLGSSSARVASAALALVFIGLGVWFLGGGIYLAIKAEVAQILLDKAFDKTLQDGQEHKPWGWADTWPVAKISFPDFGREIIVLDKTSGQALAFGPGLMAGLTEIGQPGTALIAAHNDTHFTFLEKAEVGQDFKVETRDGKTYHFKVTGFEIVDTRNPLTLEPREDSFLILSTCYPFKSLAEQTPYRYLVTARLVPN